MKTLLVTKKAIIDFDSIKEIRYGDNPPFGFMPSKNCFIKTDSNDWAEYEPLDFDEIDKGSYRVSIQCGEIQELYLCEKDGIKIAQRSPIQELLSKQKETLNIIKESGLQPNCFIRGEFATVPCCDCSHSKIKAFFRSLFNLKKTEQAQPKKGA